MKATQLAVVLLIVCISSAAALICNKCTPYSNTGACRSSLQTCAGPDEVCASIVCTYPIRTVTMKTCMKGSATYMFEEDPNCEISTCSTDQCN